MPAIPEKHRPLIRGLIVCFIAAALFFLLAFNALRPGALVEFDLEVAQRMREFSQGEHYLGHVLIGFTTAGGAPAMILLCLCGLGWAILRRQRFMMAVWVLIPLGGAILNTSLKLSLARDRPAIDLRDPFVHHKGTKSFPSGHAMGSTVGFGVLGYVCWLASKGRPRRWWIAFGLGLVVLMVGFSRVYLRAHWFSDVIAGFLVGAAWLALNLGIMETVRRQRPAEPEAPIEGGAAAPS